MKDPWRSTIGGTAAGGDAEWHKTHGIGPNTAVTEPVRTFLWRIQSATLHCVVLPTVEVPFGHHEFTERRPQEDCPEAQELVRVQAQQEQQEVC